MASQPSQQFVPGIPGGAKNTDTNHAPSKEKPFGLMCVSEGCIITLTLFARCIRVLRTRG
jgi:hypothetical protein